MVLFLAFHRSKTTNSAGRFQLSEWVGIDSVGGLPGRAHGKLHNLGYAFVAQVAAGDIGWPQCFDQYENLPVSSLPKPSDEE